MMTSLMDNNKSQIFLRTTTTTNTTTATTTTTYRLLLLHPKNMGQLKPASPTQWHKIGRTSFSNWHFKLNQFRLAGTRDGSLGEVEAGQDTRLASIVVAGVLICGATLHIIYPQQKYWFDLNFDFKYLYLSSLHSISLPPPSPPPLYWYITESQ